MWRLKNNKNQNLMLLLTKATTKFLQFLPKNWKQKVGERC